MLLIRPLNYGIEFNGGVRIPITLEKQVDQTTMDEMVDSIKQSINKYGLSQSIVRPLGNSEILVEIPKGSEGDIKSIQRILNEQGTFEAILDGKTALLGADIIPGAVGGPSREEVLDSGQWRLTFLADKNGAERFTNAACGKGEYPIYMFLNRPENAAIILNRSMLDVDTSGKYDVEKVLIDSLQKDGDAISLVFLDDFEAQKSSILNKSKIIVASSMLSANPFLKAELKQMGFGNESKKIVEAADSEIQFYLSSLTDGELVVNKWQAIGLFYAPPIASELGNCIVPPSPGYIVQGGSDGKNAKDLRANAVKELKVIKSVLTGKKLAVQTTIGSSFVVAPSLGKQFLFYSWIAIFVAVIAVSIVIFIRYRNPLIVLPIIIISLIENFITTSVTGLIGTLDLAAMAGIIAIIGTGVNDQIVITDELVRNKGKLEDEEEQSEKAEEKKFKIKLDKAFEIIFAIAGVAVIAMFPLLVSNIVEIMGFALSTIIGILVGVFITRPAFGVIIKEVVK